MELVNGLSLDQVLRKSGILPKIACKVSGTVLRKICYLSFAKSGHPIFRATTPLSRGKLKSKGKGKVSIHFSAEPDTIDTIYRIILSANQLSIYGAVAAICDEFVGQPDNTGEPVVLEGQSIVLGEVKAEVPAQEEPEDSNIALRKYFSTSPNDFHLKTD